MKFYWKTRWAPDSFQRQHVQRRSNERSHLVLNVLQVGVAGKTQTTYGGEQTLDISPPWTFPMPGAFWIFCAESNSYT